MSAERKLSGGHPSIHLSEIYSVCFHLLFGSGLVKTSEILYSACSIYVHDTHVFLFNSNQKW